MPSADLERDIDLALHRLPAPRAPRTLAPRVMQAIAARAYAVAVAPAGWRRWPPVWRALGLVVACSIVAAIVVGVPLLSSYVANMAGPRAVAGLWEMFVAPLVAPALVVVTVMCTAAALLLAALKHIAWEPQWTSHS
jgi:hypothetical protein